MAWGWIVAIVYCVVIPLAIIGMGFLDERVHDLRDESRDDGPLLYVIGFFWPFFLLLGIVVNLPSIGRAIYRWRKTRREAKDAYNLRLEAEMKVVRAERARAAPYRAKRTRLMDLRK